MNASNRFWIGSLLLISCTAIAYPSHAGAPASKADVAAKAEPDCQWRRTARIHNPGRVMPIRRRCIAVEAADKATLSIAAAETGAR